jgi:hypothetical protein
MWCFLATHLAELVFLRRVGLLRLTCDFCCRDDRI